MRETELAERLLAWFDEHGRHDLPWQHPRTPYRVWVAEIMLQQTQVTAVIGYFERFMTRFPDVTSLAEADADEVMRYWAGLGYYARARNLHAAARRIVSEHGGELPAELDALMELPGIGRSTAGAILAQAYGKWAPILDGNAKRVLARVHGERGAPGESAFERRLWAHAERCTPRERVTDYTQAIMDLGATVCTRSRPRCERCPLAGLCVAHAQALTEVIPASRKRRERPLKRTRMLLVRRKADEVLLERRPLAGVWGGLWVPPEVPEEMPAEDYCREKMGIEPTAIRELPELRHGFTHFELAIRPIEVLAEPVPGGIMEDNRRVWYKRAAPPAVPAPIKRLLETLEAA